MAEIGLGQLILFAIVAIFVKVLVHADCFFDDVDLLFDHFPPFSFSKFFHLLCTFLEDVFDNFKVLDDSRFSF